MLSEKTRRNILNILISVYEFSQVKGAIISSGSEILLPRLEYVPLYAENNFCTPIKLLAPRVGAVRLRSKNDFFVRQTKFCLELILTEFV